MDKGSQEVRTLDYIKKRLEDFKNAGDNWDGFDAKPLSQNVVDRTIKVLELLPREVIELSDDFYMSTYGTFIIDWDIDGVFLELEIGKDLMGYFYDINERGGYMNEGAPIDDENISDSVEYFMMHYRKNFAY